MKSLIDLKKMIEPAVTALNYELVGCQLAQENGRKIVRVFIDQPGGIKIDDCVAVTRQINALLNVEDPMMGRYELEVTSPGLDRPLFTIEHYQRFIGSKVRIRLQIPEGDRKNFTGVLMSVEGDKIALQMDDNTTSKWSFNQIEKANLVPEL